MPIYLRITIIVLLMSGLVAVRQTLQRSETKPFAESTMSTEETILADTSSEMDRFMPPFADGTYTTSFAYEIPYDYTEPMDVSLVFENGVIVDASVKLEAKNPTSASYQELFMEYYKDEVVGQLIEVVSLSRVGGASLTNNAFDMALAAAKAKASSQEMIVPKIVPMKLPTFQRNVDSTDLENVSFKEDAYLVEDTYFVMTGLSKPMRTITTLDDGIIADATAVLDTQDMHSEYYQRDFVAANKTVVIGASITGSKE